MKTGSRYGMLESPSCCERHGSNVLLAIMLFPYQVHGSYGTQSHTSMSVVIVLGPDLSVKDSVSNLWYISYIANVMFMWMRTRFAAVIVEYIV